LAYVNFLLLDNIIADVIDLPYTSSSSAFILFLSFIPLAYIIGLKLSCPYAIFRHIKNPHGILWQRGLFREEFFVELLTTRGNYVIICV